MFWLVWFLQCLGRAIEASEEIIGKVLRDLVEKGFLEVRGAGRSTHYVLAGHPDF